MIVMRQMMYTLMIVRMKGIWVWMMMQPLSIRKEYKCECNNCELDSIRNY